MSAYAHRMEREYSTRSLTSREDSEVTSSMGSIESGFYVTSFAATVFIASLVTMGILLVSLLIALTVKLQSCETKNAGMIEIKRFSSSDYDACRIFYLHVEFNGLEEIKCPSTCRDLAVSYIRGGQYERDLNISIAIANNHYNEIQPADDGLDLILVDIDHLFPSSHRRSELDLQDSMDKANHLRNRLILKLYLRLQASGWSLGLLTRKLEQERSFITSHLLSVGFGDWSSLIMRLDNEMQMSNQEYFYRQREVLRKAGFRIKGTISDQMDALTGSGSGERVFKIPNPVPQNLWLLLDRT